MVKKQKTSKRSSIYAKYYREKVKGEKNKDSDSAHPNNKSANRRSRVYQRKRRVAGQPKKIYRRFKKIINTIHNCALRTKIVKDMISESDIDSWQRSFRGKIEDGYETAADTTDLMKEVVDMLDKNSFYFQKKVTKMVDLYVNDTKVTVPWPIDIADEDVVYRFLADYLLLYDGKIYHSTYHTICISGDFTLPFVNMCTWTIDDRIQLSEYLKNFGTTIDGLKNKY